MIPLEAEFAELERHRRELTAHCYRMLGSPFEAEDAVQEALLRAWRGREQFEHRATVRSWLYRIATNVCLDMLGGGRRRARPMDLGQAGPPALPEGVLPGDRWIEPVPDSLVIGEADPAEVTVARESVRLAFVAALQILPPRQRAVLLLCDVLRWQASEAADMLGSSVASVTSALQRARATLAAARSGVPAPARVLDEPGSALLARYVDAFERYDMATLTSLIHQDATQSMPPYELWLSGRADILSFWAGPGAGCSGSRVIPAPRANGLPAFGQYKPSQGREGYEPWALQVLAFSGGKVAEFSFFLDTPALFPLFGLPARLPG